MGIRFTSKSQAWLWAVVLLAFPLVLQSFGNAWVRIADMSLLYVMLALGLNVVVHRAVVGCPHHAGNGRQHRTHDKGG